jgi:hypothetical protein
MPPANKRRLLPTHQGGRHEHVTGAPPGRRPRGRATVELRHRSAHGAVAGRATGGWQHWQDSPDMVFARAGTVPPEFGERLEGIADEQP